MADARLPAKVTIREHFDILIDEPLPEFDTPPAIAYRVRHRQNTELSLVALVCDPRIPIRYDMFSKLEDFDTPYFMNLHDWGIAEWPPHGKQHPVIIFERPPGQRLLTSLDETFEPMNEDLILSHVAKPAYQVLRQFRQANLVHRAIRPDNMYYDPSSDKGVAFGQCVSAPPAVQQPIVFEPIESSLANPLARGEGSAADDLYALGVVVMTLLRGAIPCAGMSDQDILYAKLAKGSYGALSQEGRISLTMMEGLRGLLTDDVSERWSVDDLGRWANGARASPIQPSISARAARSLNFAGREHHTCREIAYTMTQNWDMAISIINDGTLDTWLRRSLGDEAMVVAVNQARTDLSAEAATNDNLVTARVCIALDPDAPIRYQNLSVKIAGFKHIAPLFLEDREVLSGFTQILSHNLVGYWIESQLSPNPDDVQYIRTLIEARTFLQRTAIGEGVERAIYELNPHVPCMSLLLEDEYVLDIEQLLPALERTASRRNDIRFLIDRHIAAFATARHNAIRTSDFRGMENEVEAYMPAIVATRVLSMLQERAATKRAYPNLSALAAKLLKDAVKRFHSRAARKKVEDDLNSAAKSGILMEVLQAIDNTEALTNDERNFEFAVHEYKETIARLQQIESDRTNRVQLSHLLGGQVSSILSGFITTIVAVVIVVYVFLVA